MKHIYITTTLPYVNAKPHIGFALEIVQADAWVRTQRALGDEVVFNTGTDEHGQKIHDKAIEAGIETQAYTDKFAQQFDNLKQSLNLSYTNFLRTTNPDHKKAAQEIWRRCLANGDIYKKMYQAKYCVGCELMKTDSELVDGRCPIHPNMDIQLIEEENYFFRFSAYSDKLLKYYDENPEFVKPDFRLQEIRNFVAAGLEDFSISRLKSKMPWGVAVPDDEDHVMYVWFDALVSYISTLGWPTDEAKFNTYWPGIQVAGKDNLRQQSAMWQAMLMSAQLPPSKQIFIHGFITVNGQKMSKSLGNVIDPFDMVETYGTDAVRYYLLREIPALDDGDFTIERMEQVYESDLANELGNLLSRVTTIAAKDKLVLDSKAEQTIDAKLVEQIGKFSFNEALEDIWKEVKKINKQVNEREPWKREAADRKADLEGWLTTLHQIGVNLQPFMPETAEKILAATSGTIEKCQPLFPRIEKKQ
ncbi:MAG: methionine--tRNA ligase [Weeksellaceae bacterium]